jgi:hypothetical protein
VLSLSPREYWRSAEPPFSDLKITRASGNVLRGGELRVGADDRERRPEARPASVSGAQPERGGTCKGTFIIVEHRRLDTASPNRARELQAQ